MPHPIDGDCGPDPHHPVAVFATVTLHADKEVVMLRPFRFVPWLFFLLCVAQPALAAWPHDPSVNVLSSAPSVSASPAACVSDGAGGTIIGWIDVRAGVYEIYAQRISSAGVPLWGVGGIQITSITGGGFKGELAGISDGSGGIIMAWDDNRNSNSDVYAQRVNGAGSPLWTANGVRLSTFAVADIRPQLVSDGTGGAIISYTSLFSGGDYDIYAQHVNAAGSIPAGWNPGFGVAVCVFVAIEDYAVLCSDGAGGAILAWEDQRSGNLDIYAARVTAAGGLPWTSGGNVIDASANDQRLPRIASDGSGGAVIAWMDRRSGTNNDVYTQRVNASGANLWFNFSVPLCTAADDDAPDTVVPDGSGGAIVAMTSHRVTLSDVYAQHVTSGGAIAAGWPNASIGGVAVCSRGNQQDFPPAVSDGAGGAILAWRDARDNFSYDVYAARVTGGGTLAAGWVTDGAAVCIANSDQFPVELCSDGAGGAIVAWTDPRSGTGAAVYTQRIERFGQLGNPEPAITNVKDVPNDQGGSVKLTWSPSYLDNDPQFAIGTYWIWRSVPGSIANGALARGQAVLAEDGVAPAPGRRLFKFTTEGATTYAWEFLGSQVAQAFPSYSMTLATSGDSIPGSNPYTAFMVEAKPPSGNQYWNSAPDSGYSVDNRGPAMPAPFTGQWVRDVGTSLAWGANQEPDLAGYRLYRGTSAGFTPNPGNLVAEMPGTSTMDGSGTVDTYYKLAAFDLHGNVSPYALLAPSGTVDAPAPSLPRELALDARGANPVHGVLLLRLALPRAAEVSLAVFDPAGRRVRTLLSGAEPAGYRDVSWSGLDEAGRRTPSGVYLVRLEAEGRTIVRRFLALR